MDVHRKKISIKNNMTSVVNIFTMSIADITVFNLPTTDITMGWQFMYLEFDRLIEFL